MTSGQVTPPLGHSFLICKISVTVPASQGFVRTERVNVWEALSTESGTQYADTVVMAVVEMVTMMTKELQWKKKPRITKGMELAQGHPAGKGQS